VRVYHVLKCKKKERYQNRLLCRERVSLIVATVDNDRGGPRSVSAETKKHKTQKHTIPPDTHPLVASSHMFHEGHLFSLCKPPLLKNLTFNTTEIITWFNNSGIKIYLSQTLLLWLFCMCGGWGGVGRVKRGIWKKMVGERLPVFHCSFDNMREEKKPGRGEDPVRRLGVWRRVHLAN